jgi:hypothetical protein
MSLQEILEEQKKQQAALVIQKAWTRYWYTPNANGEARYANYAWKNYISHEVKA